MALGNKQNILVGAAAIFIGPTGNTRPATVTRQAMLDGADGSTSTGVGTLITNWRNVGFTQDGLEISTDPSYGEVEVDQLLDAALIFKDGMGLSISTTFAEATLENLLVAWGQEDEITTSPGTSEIDILGGSLGEAPLERGLIAIGNAPRLASGAYGERLYHAFRVLSVESASISVARADASTIPITFRAMPDDNGKYGIVRDTTDVA
jgi:hypothetical protein